jgi:DNA-binding Lrp family transcriptional regulator
MDEIPTAADLDRRLSTIMHEAHEKARAESAGLKSEFAAHGAGRSPRLIAAVAGRVNAIHKQAFAEAIPVVLDFAKRMQIDIKQLSLLARPHLEGLANTLLAEIPVAGFAVEQLRFRTQYGEVFDLRLDRAFRDVEIGLTQDRSAIADPQTSQSQALRLLKGLYDRGRDRSEIIPVARLAQEVGLSEQQAQSAWRYLQEKGLIETFHIPFTARIDAAGVDAVEAARRDSDQPSRAFPSISYNAAHVDTVIDAQQAGAQPAPNQTGADRAQDDSDLAFLVREFAAHFEELRLEAGEKQTAKTQLAALEAQLAGEPNPVRVQQAGRALRNITEDAISDHIAKAARPTVWDRISAIMSAEF